MAEKLPFKIRNLSRGAQKARREMMKFYGREEGARIWAQKAEEQGTGSTLRKKVNSIYKRGAKIARPKD